ncbi:3-oxoacyl-[acyl-carrier-protein] reductase FabG [Streptomyces sp. RB5]|uniref:3-oxoacyl-[acyl-carrier-protein] reductase FabG n=1 Tax=Streptomyces smaragdinus TaxID=2585196 RepID=A0A7K0CQC4_9ACTN|nr:SDR family oxidoreductase [Streptomyces smaragdinus]MQY15675.1 3-oxoacyl-[acyl-carrier-protein] reductase FabG [Streptomyces smaragdinus]
MERSVLVTGGSGGLGRAIAGRFAADGASVVITGRRAEPLALAAKELGVRGEVCDATDPARVAALAGRLGSLDVLVNAAGGLPEADGSGAPLETLLAQWHSSLARNLLGAVLTTAAVRDLLAAGDGGAVISIGSIGAERRGGSYGAAKAALAAWNASYSAEVGPLGITANVIAAGYVAGTDFFRGGMTPERHAALLAEAHDGRAGTPADIAETAFFLASKGARHLTGQTVHVNGGAFTTR